MTTIRLNQSLRTVQLKCAAIRDSPERSWTAEFTRFPLTYVSDPSHGSNVTITVGTEDNSLPPADFH